jgi:hypothetical protein
MALFNNIKQKLETGEPMDQIFSRKRSFSKSRKHSDTKESEENEENSED